MKTVPIQPARVVFNERGLPFAPDFGDVYHAAAGAFGQARQVFLGGNGLPQRWAGRERFVILETGFGLGNNFLATWAAWRDDPQRCERLVFVSIEKHPLRRDDLARMHAKSPEPALATQLVAQWPLLTPNLHLLDFEGGRVQLLLAFGDAEAMLPELQAEVDALYLDGFAPSKNAAMWSPELFKRMTRLLATGATAATWSASRAVRDGLSSMGFAVEKAAGFGGKRDMTIARWTPRFVPPRPAAWRPVREGGEREALIIGGGLAGCAAAWGLHMQGWHSTVLDRQPDPAMETSGNPGGLMHGIFNVADGPHARWFRAAALHTARWAQPAVTRGDVAGALDGLLRLDEALDSTAGLHDAVAQFKAVLDEPGYLTALDLAATRDASKLALPHAAWRFGAAGWLAPRAWSRWLLEASGARWQGNTQVAQVRRVGSHWQALDGAGRLLAQAPVLVLAHGLGARELWPEGTPALPLQAIRGQTTIVPATVSGLVRPTLPVSGGGYALTLPNGDVLIGATQQHHDDERALREADQQHNIRRAAALGVLPPTAMLPLQGRVGWRATVQGRLPVIGAPVDEALVQAAEAAGQRLHALHHLPRLHDADGGLYVFTALGSRGITSAALGARLLASWISGAPCPVEASLRDALDPARRLSPR